MSAASIRGKSFSEATLSAVIIYDDSAVAAKVRFMLARSVRRAQRTSQWEIEPWRLDMLAQHETKHAALTSAIQAHLLVLAIRRQERLEPWFFEWLEDWAEQRQIEDVAFAVVDGGNGMALSAATAAELSRFAERHGLSFMLGDAGMAEDKSTNSGRPPAHEDEFMPALQRIWEETAHDQHQGWGINE